VLVRPCLGTKPARRPAPTGAAPTSPAWHIQSQDEISRNVQALRPQPPAASPRIPRWLGFRIAPPSSPHRTGGSGEGRRSASGVPGKEEHKEKIGTGYLGCLQRKRGCHA